MLIVTLTSYDAQKMCLNHSHVRMKAGRHPPSQSHVRLYVTHPSGLTNEICPSSYPEVCRDFQNQAPSAIWKVKTEVPFQTRRRKTGPHSGKTLLTQKSLSVGPADSALARTSSHDHSASKGPGSPVFSWLFCCPNEIRVWQEEGEGGQSFLHRRPNPVCVE